VTDAEGVLLYAYGGCLFKVPEGVQPPKAGSLFFARSLPARAGERVLEIGGGLGLAAVLAARAGARVVATDVVPEAVEAMRANALLNGVAIDARLGDCYAPVAGERFDVICSNPPQMPTPAGPARGDASAVADNGGADGWEILDRIIAGAPGHLRAGGRLVFTIFAFLGRKTAFAKVEAAGLTPSVLATETQAEDRRRRGDAPPDRRTDERRALCHPGRAKLAMTRRLIVNADDFGLTPGVTAGILAAHRHGIVTSTTSLVTSPIEARAIAEARESGIGIGLHVNFTLGAPLTGGASLVDGGGRFVRDARQAAARAKEREVEAEIDAQLDRFEQLFKRPPTHLDSHHHVGLLEPVKSTLFAAAARLRVPLRTQNAFARAAARSAGLRTPDHFFGESGPAAYWSPSRTLHHLARLPAGVSEFMAHPGLFDDHLAGSRYGRQRETELVGLGSGAARAAAMALGIALWTFDDLVG
jgi:HemK-related putative methylase